MAGMTFRHDCSRGCWINSRAWDWAILKGCFGMTGIEPTDLDGLVERNGHYLLLETKDATEHGLDVGQHITFSGLARDKDFTVIIIYGLRNQPERLTIFHPGGGVDAAVPTNLQDTRARITAWFAAADKDAA
ncbi:MAG: hypothetical protein ACRD0W_09565 [Acidimicrobiales bacterium]